MPLKLALDSAFARIYGGSSQTRFKADVAIMPHPTEESSDRTKVAFQLRYGALFFCESTIIVPVTRYAARIMSRSHVQTTSRVEAWDLH